MSDSAPFPPRDGKRQRSMALLFALKEIYTVDYLILRNQQEYFLTEKNSVKGVSFFFLPLEYQPNFIKKIGLSFRPIQANQKAIIDFLKGKDYNKVFCRYTTAAIDFPKLDYLAIDVDDDYLEAMDTKISTETNFLRKIRLGQILMQNKSYYFRILKKARILFLSKDQKLPFKCFTLPNLPFQAILSQKNRKFNPSITKNLLFVGKLSYEPNSQGIQWFLNMVWPELKRRQPEINLSIVSVNEPDKSLKILIHTSPGVHLLINVDNLEEVYRQHFLTIVPLFMGAGSNIKLAESLYFYRNVVATPFGAKGFDQFVLSGLVTLAESSQEWVEAIEQVQSKGLNEEAFSSLEDYFSFENWSKNLLKILDGN